MSYLARKKKEEEEKTLFTLPKLRHCVRFPRHEDDIDTAAAAAAQNQVFLLLARIENVPEIKMYVEQLVKRY